MYIDGQLMRLQLWTPTFRPEEETPIVLVWVILPELPWHCYNKEFITTLLDPIGKTLYLDAASLKKTRGSVAKVRIQMDITKERPQHVWLGIDEEDHNKGKWQAIQYEGLLEYCSYCKHQGHTMTRCNVKRRDEERKEAEEARNNKTRKEDDNQVCPLTTVQMPEKNISLTNTGTKENQAGRQRQHQNRNKNKEEQQEWQIQKKPRQKEQQKNVQSKQNLAKQTGIDLSLPSPQVPINGLDVDANDTVDDDCNKKKMKDSGIDLSLPHLQVPINDLDAYTNDTLNDDCNTTKMKDSGIDLSLPHPQVPIIGLNADTNDTLEDDCNITKMKEPGIDLSLPQPHGSPNNFNVENDVAVVVHGGEDGGIQEEPTNLQEGVTRGRESTLVDPRKDIRAPATTEVTTTTVTRKERHNEHSQQEEDCYTMDKEPPDPKRQNESPQAFNNKSTLALSKKKRDALKKKIIKEMQSGQQSLHDVLVVEHAGIYVTALQIQKPDTGKCALNKEITPQELTDEYRVTHSEDEKDPDQYDEVQKEEEEKRALSTRGQQENRKKKQQDDTTSSDNAICKSGIKTRSKSNKSQ
ncbi:uncharacterized protein LOC129872594 [Solanum dulcamara]|uniref:uncharacterized protein LOC129872594 n=1 Tax=Solanum dulcamara TaxID=45834 RepID=UPI0024858BA0|nr:uncharacterized protein LOC129872594 [Solanum dulcamara]